MKDLKYIIARCGTGIGQAGCVQQPEFDRLLSECYPLSRHSGILKIDRHIERSYHIITEHKEMADQEENTIRTEIARIRVVYKPDQTEILISGRKSEDVLESLRKKDGFSWEEKKNNYNGHIYPHSYHPGAHSI